MKPNIPETTYEIEQGIVSPRDDSISWSTYEVAHTLEAATKVALANFNNKALWRIRKTETVSVSRVYQERTANVTQRVRKAR